MKKPLAVLYGLLLAIPLQGALASDCGDSVRITIPASGHPGTVIPSPATTPVGTNPTPIAGPHSDLRPDFDIKNSDGSRELSSNCDNCDTTPLRPEQDIRTVLTVQVSNADAGKYNRNTGHEKISGVAWYRIPGVQDSWQQATKGEYTIGKLDNGRSIQETQHWTVPDLPGKSIHFKACVDTDDEIYEENEGSSSRKITNPDQSGTTNNCSRVERFNIKYRADLLVTVGLSPNTEFVDAMAPIDITVKAYAVNDDAGKHARAGATTIRAPVWYRIPGSQESWTSVASAQFSTGALDEGRNVFSTVRWTVPNAPGKNVQIAVCIDGDDAIREIDEDASTRPITNPDTYGGGNNCTFAEMKVSEPEVIPPLETPIDPTNPTNIRHVNPATLKIIIGN